jgi:DNA-binding PadR family transcriptional regulator
MREFLRGAVRLHILHHAAHGEVHGAWMAKELAQHGYRISPGSLYPTLHKMETEGLLRSSQQVVDGRARRSYVATAKGRRALGSIKRQLRELANELLGDELP